MNVTSLYEARTIDIARRAFINHRVNEMLTDPCSIAQVAKYAAEAHPTKFGTALDLTMRERATGLADLIDTMVKAAEDMAQQEWIVPVDVTA